MPKSGQIESGIRLAVGFGSPAGSSAFGSGTEFEAEHSESFLAGLDEELAEKYFAEARHVKRMAAHFDAGAIRFDTLTIEQRKTPSTLAGLRTSSVPRGSSAIFLKSPPFLKADSAAS